MTRFIIPLAFVLVGCGGGSKPDSGGLQTPGDGHAAAGETSAGERKAYEAARPIFVAHCAKCHSKDSKKAQAKTIDHFDMTGYPFGGHHAGEISAEVRKALGIGGGKPTMPKDHPGAVQGDDLALIAAWADAFDRSHEGSAHEGHGDGHDHDHHAP